MNCPDLLGRHLGYPIHLPAPPAAPVRHGVELLPRPHLAPSIVVWFCRAARNCSDSQDVVKQRARENTDVRAIEQNVYANYV